MTSMSGMSSGPRGPNPVLSGARSALLGGDAGDVRYPWYLINGRVRTAPRRFSARPGQRVRIRFINAAADTSFRVALGGHQMTVTHTDGYPVAPVRADALLIGMGERYDVQVTLYDGVFPLTALAEGKNATGAGPGPDRGRGAAAPRPSGRPSSTGRSRRTLSCARRRQRGCLPASPT
jgi:FtsP/CotA-like multicopper oxidase with cupredoxin domain